MTAKRFRLGIDNKNGVGLFDREIRLLYIRFNNIEDTVSCKDALNRHCNLMNELHEENKQLKKELAIYRKLASCSNCEYHNYDWYDDGDEFEVCDIGNDVTEGICEKWEEL